MYRISLTGKTVGQISVAEKGSLFEMVIMCPRGLVTSCFGERRGHAGWCTGRGAKGHEVRRNEAVVCFE